MTTGLDRRGKAERHLLEWIMEMGARNSLRAQKGAKNCAKVWATPETWPACSDGFSYTSVCFLVCPFSWDVLRNWSQGGKGSWSSVRSPGKLGFQGQGRCRAIAFGLIASPSLHLTVTTAKQGKTEAKAFSFTGPSSDEHTGTSLYTGTAPHAGSPPHTVTSLKDETSPHEATSPHAGASQPATHLDSASTEDTGLVRSSKSR